MIRLPRIAIFCVSVMACAFGQGIPDTPSRRLLRASQAEQVASVSSALDQGLTPEQFQIVGPLFYDKSALVLPLVEQKIEQVLKSATPRDQFTVKNIDPARFVHIAASAIAQTGDEQALKEIAKLI